MYDWNGSIRSLNVGLPDDIARLNKRGAECNEEPECLSGKPEPRPAG